MTANELLALLGRAWPRLLIYPGGLAAFLLIWLIERTQNRKTAKPQNRRTEDRGSRIEDRPAAIFHPRSSVAGWLEASAIVLPWLGLALLPLPHAAGMGRQIDMVAALALLEWPLLLAIAIEVCDCVAARARVARRLAATLNSYPPLILATLLLASAYGSFDTTTLGRPPDASTPARAAWLHWLGAGAWLLALPPALGIGAFATSPPQQPALRLGLQLRRLGLVALATLPWLPLAAGPDTNDQGNITPAWLWLLVPPLVLTALLWGYSRLTRGRAPQPWARAYLALDATLLAILLWAAYTALQARLV